MIEAFEILTFLWLAICAGCALNRIGRGSRSSILFVYLVFFGLFAVPLVADLIYGIPIYDTEPGFYTATRDPSVRILYCLFVSSIPFFWLRKTSIQRNRVRPRQIRVGNVTMAALWAGAFLPLLALPFAPVPRMYLEYGFIVSQDVPIPVYWFHSIMAALTVLSIVCGAAVLASVRNLRRGLWLILPLAATAIFLNGKRAIFALAIISFLLVFWSRRLLTRKRFFGAVCGAALVIGAFSVTYESAIRDISAASTSPEYAYKNTRIDYGRDSRVKMAMYAELHPNQIQILDYRGESLLFDLSFWIPRSIWQEKPYPYAVYFTSAMLGTKVGLLGWGMTTSFLDEAIANFSWLGVIIGPIVIWGICRVGDLCNEQKTSILTVVVGALMLSVHLAAFLPLFLGWIVLVSIGLTKRRKSGRSLFSAEQMVMADGTSVWVLSRIGRA